jgi:hypothetical protein
MEEVSHFSDRKIIDFSSCNNRESSIDTSYCKPQEQLLELLQETLSKSKEMVSKIMLLYPKC